MNLWGVASAKKISRKRLWKPKKNSLRFGHHLFLFFKLVSCTLWPFCRFYLQKPKRDNPKIFCKSQNIFQIEIFFFKITVEKFDKSKKLLQILRKSVDPQITFSIIRKYFSKYFLIVPFRLRLPYLMHASFRSATAKNSKILTPTRTGNFLLTSMHWEFYATSRFVFGVNALYGWFNL